MPRCNCGVCVLCVLRRKKMNDASKRFRARRRAERESDKECKLNCGHCPSCLENKKFNRIWNKNHGEYEKLYYQNPMLVRSQIGSCTRAWENEI